MTNPVVCVLEAGLLVAAAGPPGVAGPTGSNTALALASWLPAGLAHPTVTKATTSTTSHLHTIYD